MMPLGLTPTQLAAYHRRLLLPHDFKVGLDILHFDEKAKGRLTGEFMDGQVNIQRGGGAGRSMTLTAFDPGHSLHLDDNTPFDGAPSFNRLVRVRHMVEMPFGLVIAIPFVGPMTKPTREGDVVTLECQDKSVLAMEGRPPMTRRKGYNAVQAILDFMRATGERHFRFNVPARLRRKRLKDPYSIGWTRPPLVVCRQIAERELEGLQLDYACDGFLMLRPEPSEPAVVYDITDLTSGVKIDYDRSNVRNHVRVTGEIPPPRNSNKKPKPFTETATARGTYFMSPGRMERNDAPGWLPLVISDSSIKKHSVAKDRAEAELAKATPLQVTASFAALPFFHLDRGDKIRLVTPDGTFNTPLREASIPLGTGGDSTVGIQKPVARVRRTGKRART